MRSIRFNGDRNEGFRIVKLPVLDCIRYEVAKNLRDAPRIAVEFAHGNGDTFFYLLDALLVIKIIKCLIDDFLKINVFNHQIHFQVFGMAEDIADKVIKLLGFLPHQFYVICQVIVIAWNAGQMGQSEDRR